MALPLVAAMALAGAGGLTRAVTTGIASAVDPMAKEQRARLKELTQLERTGGLGLSGDALREAQNRTFAPVRQQAGALESAIARQNAAMGYHDAAALGEATDAAGAVLGAGSVAAGQALRQEDVAMAERQRAEKAQLEAAMAARRNAVLEGVLGGLVSGAGSAGMAFAMHEDGLAKVIDAAKGRRVRKAYEATPDPTEEEMRLLEEALLAGRTA